MNNDRRMERRTMEKKREDDRVRYHLRIDKTLMDRLRYAAQCNGLNANEEIENLIRQHIAEFEREHGEIEPK